MIKKKEFAKFIHTYHSLCISEGVAEAFQIFFRDAYGLSKLLG
jgi:hypothetical protein